MIDDGVEGEEVGGREERESVGWREARTSLMGAVPNSVRLRYYVSPYVELPYVNTSNIQTRRRP